MLKPKYLLLISLLLWFNLSFKALATTLVIYQQSQIAGNVIAYLNDHFLLIYVPKSKLWYLLDNTQQTIKVFNEENQLSYSNSIQHFRGSVAVRSSTYFRKQLENFPWQLNTKLVLINKTPCKLALIKTSKNPNTNTLASDFAPLSTLLINQPTSQKPLESLNSTALNIQEVKCYLSDAQKLNSAESYFIGLIFGLPNLLNYPIAATIYYHDGKINKFIETTKITTTSDRLESILPKLKFQTAKTESKVYNLSKEISPMVKDMLGIE